jgi:hypothetical protein
VTWAWLLLALLVRVAFALKLGGRQHQIDEGAYFNTALSLASHGTLGAGAVIPPVPVAFFAAFLKLFGTSMLWPRLGQAAVGTFTAWAVGASTEDLSGSRRAGRLALAVAAVYPFFVYYNGMLMSETLDVAVIVPGLWLLCRSLRGGQAAEAAGAGLLLGLAALCRAEGAFIMAVVWAAAAALRRDRLKMLALAFGIWLLPILFWCARNQAVVGRFALDIHGGMTLLHGTELFELNEVDTGVAQRAFQETPAYLSSRNLPEAERDRLYMKEAVAFMKAHPGRTLAQWTLKLATFWRLWPRTDKPYQEDAGSHPSAGLPRGALVAISLLFEPALILGGLYGLWLLRSRMLELFPLYGWLLGTMGVHVISVSQMRYRLPVMPLLILGAAVAVSRRIDSAR